MKDDRFASGCFINIHENSVTFCGIIASLKQLNKTTVVLFLGVDIKQYIEVIVTQSKKNYINSTHIGIKGTGLFQKNRKYLNIIECDSFKAF